MKKLILAALFVASTWNALGQNSGSTLSVIPEPVSVKETTGYFKVPPKINLLCPQGTENDLTISFLKKKLSLMTDVQVNAKKTSSATVQLVLNQATDSIIGAEGYSLSVTPQKVLVKANTPAGLYYGVQTLVQLLPAEVEGHHKVKQAREWKIPAMEIIDYPRFAWRGLMLDVSRHFFTPDEVKRFIDRMSHYKYNTFHWHLTDDEGWRIEIKSLPKLTEKGAWRVEKIGNFGSFSNPLPEEPKNYGGFYTQDEIRDIVKYAQERFVRVMPEIDMPGHSMAAIAAYPELATIEDAESYHVRAGEPIIDWTTRPRHTALKDNNLSPTKEVVYDFVNKVMSEVAELFPFEYIHVGGDEATYNFWEKSPEVAELMAREKLQNMAEVQSYFEHRVEKIIQSKGKKMMGWDEILEGGVSPSTAVMSWRGLEHGVKASNTGHYVVMSPTQYAYLDYMQGDASTEAPVYATLRLDQTYKFNPVPAEANPRFVLGGQANLWTEQVYNYRQVEYMIWPRGFAIAESLWSPESRKDWSKFVNKTEEHFKRSNYAGVKYSPAIYDPIVAVTKSGDDYLVTLTTEIGGLDIYTSFDNSTPDCFYPKYVKSQLIPKDAKLMRIITYRGKEVAGRLMTISVEDLKKRAK
jgi:hexosaminidase